MKLLFTKHQDYTANQNQILGSFIGVLVTIIEIYPFFNPNENTNWKFTLGWHAKCLPLLSKMAPIYYFLKKA